MRAALIYPQQLFSKHPAVRGADICVLVEEPLRMSNFRKGPWCAVWDALYWRFIDRHRDFFAGNPRMAVIVAQCERLGGRLDDHRRTAAEFLARLHGDP